MGANAWLYNGRAFEHYWNGVTGHPFFLSDEFKKGTLYYGGTVYESVPILYDLLRDEVVSTSFNKKMNIILVSDKIGYFNIGPHTFIRLNSDSGNAALISGFYELLYRGGTNVLEKRAYRIELSVKAEDNTSKFKEYNHYYIERDRKYHAIETESDLLNLLNDQRLEMRKFLGKRDIHFKKDPGGTIVQAAEYYDRLKK